MSSINFATREITCKIVYYGPGLSGKTTNLQVIHQKIPKDKKTEMLSLATEGDRTLFFDFLPLNLGNIKGFKTKFQLYTVPGQVYYNSTRKLVLRGVDGVVFVADSQKSRQAENLDSLQNLRQNLKDYDLDLDELPLILQYNKRDMPEIFSLEEMNAQLNPKETQWVPATAHNGKGVIATLKGISRAVIENFNKKQGMLHQAAAKFKGEGVHDVTLGGKGGFTVGESEAKKKIVDALPPGASPFGGFKAPVAQAPIPTAQPAPVFKQEIKSVTNNESQEASPFAQSVSAAPVGFGASPFAEESSSAEEKPKNSLTNGQTLRVPQSMFEKTPTSDSIAKKNSIFDEEEEEEEGIELKPYIPHSGN